MRSVCGLFACLAIVLAACNSGDPCREAAKNIASIRFPSAPNKDQRIDNMARLCKRKSFGKDLLACYKSGKSIVDLDKCDAKMRAQGKSGTETTP